MSTPITPIPPIERIRRQSDILLAVAVIAVIAMIIIPLPPVVLDFLVIISLIIAIVFLLITMYTSNPLNFSVFPSLILLTVVYRLALNISTTRAILAEAYAGGVIQMFGSFVVAGSYVVGFIIFLIIVIVNYLVIAHGAVRIGEVAARFTLDAMPGKQMAIDADLNSGLITEDEARKRRRDLERQADFFGAMDGAARFTQRDALAGIIIVVINIVGGFIMGMVVHDMTWDESLKTYTILTIGDGLVAAIPALLMSTAAGVIVTNAVSEAELGLGEDIARQVLVFPRPILFASIILFALGLLPGLSITARFVLFGLAGAAFGLFHVLNQAQKQELRIKEEEERVARRPSVPPSFIPLVSVDPLELEIGYSLIPLVDVEQGGDLLDRVTMIRREFAIDAGLPVPPVRIRDNMQLKPAEYSIKVKGVEVARSEVMLNHYLAIPAIEVKEKIEGIKTKEPTFGIEAYWITEENKERTENLGYTVVDVTSVIITHLSEIIRSNAPQLLGRQEVQELIDNIKKTNPTVVDELIPNLMTVGEVQKVLQNLLKERLPIKDMVTILETLADTARLTKDIDTLTEYVRAGIARAICKLYTTEDNKLKVLTVDPNLETQIATALQQTPQGAILSLEPSFAQKIIQAVSIEVEKITKLGIFPIILCSAKIRLYLKRFLEYTLPQVVVLSYNEIIPEIKIEAIGMVRIS